MSVGNLLYQHSPIRTKFEYNNFGELVQKQGSPRVNLAEPAPNPQQYLQNGYNHSSRSMNHNDEHHQYVYPTYKEQYDRIKAKQFASDKPNNMAFDPKNYQVQLQRLYGQQNPRYGNATSVANPFQRASQNIIYGKNDDYNKQFQPKAIDLAYPQTQKNLSIIKDEDSTNNLSLTAKKDYQQFDAPSYGVSKLGEMYASQAALKKNDRQADLSTQRRDQHLYVGDLYKNLRHDYTNLNLRSHMDRVIKANDVLEIGDKKRFFSKGNSVEPILANENSLRNTMARFNSPVKQYEIIKSQSVNKINPLHVLERDNRQYALSENDSVDKMMNLSKKLRSLKDIVRHSHDPAEAAQLRAAIQRRIISNNKQEERKQKLVALLGAEILEIPKSQFIYLQNKNS